MVSLSPRCVSVAALLCAISFLPAPARGHCDGVDGPVVKAAQEALKKGDAKLVLVWVAKKDEPEITSALQHALAVRKLGQEAAQLADRFFFETVVRVHRAHEGAPYTGLKPAGRDLGPAIPAADRALETGDPRPMLKLVEQAVHGGIHEKFSKALAAKKYDPADVEAGRKFVENYVVFIHFVERLYEDATQTPSGHVATAQAEAAHAH